MHTSGFQQELFARFSLGFREVFASIIILNQFLRAAGAPARRPGREQRDVSDHVALNIPQHRDVKLNELPKQIFMLLPLLLHWLYFSIRGGQNGENKGNEAAEAAA